MDRLPLPCSPLAFAALAVVIGRRAFLKHCGVATVLTLGAGALTGCESGRESQGAAPASDGFFADGTDFAD